MGRNRMKKLHSKLEPMLLACGLGKKTAATYLALAAIGPSAVAPIARAAGLYRTDVYTALPELKKLGLVSTKRDGKRTLYVAAPTALLQEMACERIGLAGEALRAIEKREITKGPVRVLKGPKGLAAVLEDMMQTLPRGGLFLRIDSRVPNKETGRYMPAGYADWRDKAKIEQFVIVSGALRNRSYRKRLDCASKVIPPTEDAFGYDVNILIHGETVAFVDFADETAYIIKHPRIAAMQKSLFKRLYDRLPAS